MPFGSGASNVRARLSENDIEAIFEMYAGGAGVREIARRFDVAPSTISRLLRGKTWGGMMRRSPNAFNGLKSEAEPPEIGGEQGTNSPENRMREGQVDQAADYDHIVMAGKRNAKGSCGPVAGTDLPDQVVCGGDD
jgi:transposase-like protein